jgi:hypothetical protein
MIVRNRKTTKKATEVSTQQVIVPRLVKAAELAKREAAEAEAERAREMAAAAERVVKPAIRTPRNAVEARDLFNSLFNEAA